MRLTSRRRGTIGIFVCEAVFDEAAWWRNAGVDPTIALRPARCGSKTIKLPIVHEKSTSSSQTHLQPQSLVPPDFEILNRRDYREPPMLLPDFVRGLSGSSRVGRIVPTNGSRASQISISKFTKDEEPPWDERLTLR